jgi:hypothetical protein
MQLQEEGVMKSRVLFLPGISAVLLTGCGSSGGGDEPDAAEPPLVIVENYNFFLGKLNTGELLTADVGGEFTVTIDMDDGLLAGNLDLDVGANNSVTFVSYILRW